MIYSYDSDAEVILPTGSCPEMADLPPIEACQGKNSTCWSVNLPDVDCENNALCCFDGCVNACFYTDRGEQKSGHFRNN